MYGRRQVAALAATMLAPTAPALARKAVPSPRQFAVSVELRRASGEIVLASGPLPLSAGRDADFGTTIQRGYVKSASVGTNKLGKRTVLLEPGVVEHGVSGRVSMRREGSVSVGIEVAMEWIDLVGIDGFTTPDGLAIELPQVEARKLVRALAVAPGEPASVPFGDATLTVALVGG